MQTKMPAFDNKTFAIGVLSITACIMFVGLMIIGTQPATAIGQLDRGGDYILVTQQLTNSQEGCLIIDAAARQMTLYCFNGANRQLQLLHRNIPLNELPKPRPDTGTP